VGGEQQDHRQYQPDSLKRIHLIANVATHPDHRRRGIAHVLTQRAMEHARKKGTSAIWLHVRDDNPDAVKIYEELGFKETVRRTTWLARSDSGISKPESGIQITDRHPRYWNQQQEWLHRLYPDTVNWYAPLNFNALKPGLLNWFHWLFMEFELRQWAAIRDDLLLATLTWMPHGGRSESIYVAAGPESEPEAMTQLLIHARRALSQYVTLSLEYPAGEMDDAIIAAGFRPRRTLIWMRA